MENKIIRAVYLIIIGVIIVNSSVFADILKLTNPNLRLIKDFQVNSQNVLFIQGVTNNEKSFCGFSLDRGESWTEIKSNPIPNSISEIISFRLVDNYALLYMMFSHYDLNSDKNIKDSMIFYKYFYNKDSFSLLYKYDLPLMINPGDSYELLNYLPNNDSSFYLLDFLKRGFGSYDTRLIYIINNKIENSFTLTSNNGTYTNFKNIFKLNNCLIGQRNNGGLIYSMNQGKDWDRLNIPDENENSVVTERKIIKINETSNKIYIGYKGTYYSKDGKWLSNDNVLYKSIDTAKSWILLDTFERNYTDFHFDDDENLFAIFTTYDSSYCKLISKDKSLLDSFNIHAQFDYLRAFNKYIYLKSDTTIYRIDKQNGIKYSILPRVIKVVRDGISFDEPTDCEITVYDVSGKEIYSSKFQNTLYFDLQNIKNNSKILIIQIKQNDKIFLLKLLRE